MSVLDFVSKEKSEIFSLLKSRETGLTKEEVLALQQSFGFNELKIKRLNWFDVLFKQFKSAFFYLLFIAGLIALILGQRIEGILIFIFASINVLFGFWQEYRGQKAVEKLSHYLIRKTRVIRDGVEEVIDSKLLVPGDVVILEAGDILTADLRILEANELSIDESVLTGESEPVVKTAEPLSEVKSIFEAKNIAFSGTAVLSGEGRGIVINTGSRTEFGKVTKLTASIIKPSVYEKELIDFSKVIFKTVLITFLLIFILNLILKRHLDLSEFIIFCLALIVGLVPEALPVVISSALSRGALKLAKHKVVVKRLSAIEDLGNMEILCTDKTGTLTENKLKVATIGSKDKEQCLLYALLASQFFKKETLNNPFDIAIVQAIKNKERIKDFKLLGEIPFDFQRLRNSVLVQDKQKQKIIIARGAPEIILAISQFSEGEKAKILEEIKKREREGERVLGIAFKKSFSSWPAEEAEKNFSFLGYISFYDPLKNTAPAAIKLAQRLKVNIKIITGDSKEVAGKVAFDVGLIDEPSKVILGAELENLSEEDFMKKCEEFSVFARTAPAMKLRIIKALEKKYQVGFLGEGINDAPALKAAHVGVAVREAAEVSREAADIFLLDSDLKVIIEGIQEGRIIFNNINKYIKCALSSNFGNFYSVAVLSLVLPFLPMLPPQILLENILSDVPFITISRDSVDLKELRRPKAYVLSKIFPYIFILALISSAFDFIFFGLFHRQPAVSLQTLWFIFSLLTEMVLILSLRTRSAFFKPPSPAKVLLISLIATSALGLILPYLRFSQWLFLFSPPSFYSLFLIFLLCLAYLFVNELVKKIYFSRYGQ